MDENNKVPPLGNQIEAEPEASSVTQIEVKTPPNSLVEPVPPPPTDPDPAEDLNTSSLESEVEQTASFNNLSKPHAEVPPPPPPKMSKAPIIISVIALLITLLIAGIGTYFAQHNVNKHLPINQTVNITNNLRSQADQDSTKPVGQRLLVNGSGIFSGSVIAPDFYGNGAGLTDLSANNCVNCVELQPTLSSAQKGNVNVTGTGQFGNVNSGGGQFTSLNVSGGGLLGSLGVTGTGLFGNIGVGTSAPLYAVDVVGDVNASKTIRIAGNTVCDANGCTLEDGSKTAVSSLNGLTGKVTITGTPNQLTVSQSGNGLGLALPQNIAQLSTPTFAGLNLSSPLSVSSGGLGVNNLSLNGVLYGNGTNGVLTANGNAGQCLTVSGNGTPVFASCAGAGSGVNLQAVYDNSLTSPQIVLDSNPGAGGLTIRDNTTPVAGSLFSIQSNSGATTYFGVSNTTVSVGDNLTLTAGKSLTVTGGTSFPGSPTEGQIYYRSDNHQLYIYENGQWQADRTTATKIVTSADFSSVYQRGDYVVPSGATNAENTIQAAINSLPSSGGVVYIAEGTYTVDNFITIPSNVSIMGAGTGATTIVIKPNMGGSAPAAIFENLHNSNNAYIDTNIQISNLSLDGNALNGNNGGSGLILKYISNPPQFSADTTPSVRLSNISAGDFSYAGLDLINVSNAQVSQSIFDSNNYVGILNSSGRYDSFTGNNIQNNGASFNGGGIYATNGADNTYSNNIVNWNNISSNNQGIYLFYEANDTVSGNDASHNGRQGILAYNLTHSTIDNNNTNSNGLEGIYLYGSSGGSAYNQLSGNHASYNPDFGIGVLIGNGNNFTGNNSSYNGFEGFAISNFYGPVDDTVLSNNTSENNGSVGLLFGVSNYSVISGNRFNNNQTGGMTLNGSHNSVTGNSITYTAAAGSTTLNVPGGLSSGATSMTVSSANGFPTWQIGNSYTIQIDSEQITVTSGFGSTTWNITRGANGTTAAAHSNSAVVNQVLIAGQAIVIQGGTGNYLSNNIWSGTSASGISDSGTGTLYANQLDSSNNLIVRNGSSVSAFQVQNASGAIAFNVDTNNNRVGVDTLTPAYPLDVVGDVNTSTQYRIGGVVICTSSGCTPAAGSNNYVQLQSSTPGTAQTGNYNITGTAISGSVLTSNIDTASATTLNIGATNATSISLAQNTVLAAGKSLTVTGGTSFPGSPTEGQIYYRSDNHQLYIYENGQWQTDQKAATEIVADATTTPNYQQANFIVPAGSTSAQTTINAALAALPSGGGVVVMLEGTYLVSGQITVGSNQSLTGVGASTVIKIADNTNLTNYKVIYSSSTNHVSVTNLSLNGNVANNASEYAYGVYLNSVGSGSSGAYGYQLANLDIENFRFYGIDAVNGSNGIISNNNISNNSSTALQVSSSNTVITGNTIQSNGWIGMWSSGNGDTISNNNIQNNSSWGAYIQGSNSNVTGNNFSNNITYGLYLASSYLTVTGNVVNNTGGGSTSDDGIYASSITYSTISGNTFNSNTGTGLWLAYSSHNTINDNSSYGGGSSQWWDIELYFSNSNTVSGNNLNGSIDYNLGIIYTSSYNIITGNHSDNSGHEGVVFYDWGNGMETGNQFTNNWIGNSGWGGLYLKGDWVGNPALGAISNIFSGNTFYDNATAGPGPDISSDGSSGKNIFSGNIFYSNNGSSAIQLGDGCRLSTCKGDAGGNILSSNLYYGSASQFIKDGDSDTLYRNQAIDSSQGAVFSSGNSSTALNIQNGSSLSIFNVNTASQAIQVGSLPSPGTITLGLAAGGSLAASTTYYYRVTALNGTGESTGSPESSITTDTTNLSVNLSWAAIAGATSYRVYRGTSSNNENVYYTASTNSFTDTGGTSTAGSLPDISTAYYDNISVAGSTFQTPANTTTALQVLNSSGSSVFNVDTTNSRVGIGTNAPRAALDVQGGNIAINYGTGIVVPGYSNSSLLSTAFSGSRDITTLSSVGNNNQPTINLNATYVGVGNANPSSLLSVGSSNGFTVDNSGNFGAYGSGLVRTASNTTSAFQVQNSSSVNVLSVDTSNNRVSIGSIGTASGQLYVSGSVPTSAIGSVTVNGNPYAVFVVGRYAYVVGLTTGSSAFQIVDVSKPASPTVISTLALTTNSETYGVYVQAHYAYIANYNTNTIQIIDISNPSAPFITSTFSTGANTQPDAVYVQGKYAYITNFNSSTLQIVDVSNPASPASVNTFSLLGGGNPASVYVQGRYAYVADYSASGTGFLQIVDVSNPASPTGTGSIGVGGSSNPVSVYVQGRYAYMVDYGTSNLKIIDVSNPASPSVIGTFSTGSNPNAVYVQGRYAYVVDSGIGTLQVVDVSNPASPASVGTVNTGFTPYGLYVQGRYAYVVNSTSNSLQVFDMGGIYTQQLEAGGIETGTLEVDTNANIAGDASVQGGLSIGQSLEVNGNIGTNRYFLQQTTTNSSTAFQVQNASGFSVINADTSTGKVSLGSATHSIAGQLLFADGTTDGFNATITPSSLTANRTFTLGDTGGTFCTTVATTACTSVYGSAVGSGNYIQNTLTTQTANFNVQSASVSSPAGILQGAAGQTSDIFDVNTSTPVTVFAVKASGSVSVGSNGTATGQLYVSGTVPTAEAGHGTTGNNPLKVSVQGRYAYVINTGSGTLQIFDVSDPTNPTVIGSVAISGGSLLGLSVQGRYAYVDTASNLQVVNISNPSSPIVVGTFTSGTFPGDIYVQGRYAYIAMQTTLQIFDISNPSSPVSAGIDKLTSTNPNNVYVQGRYAYVTSSSSNKLVIIDVLDPVNPVTVGTVTTGTAPKGLYVVGRYAYVVNTTSNTVQIFDISNPASPVSVGTSSSVLNAGGDIYVQGRYAYIVNNGSNTLQIFDVSNPASPVSVGTVTTGTAPKGLYVQGRYAYVTNQTSNTLQSFDLGGTYSQQLQAGGIETGTLQTDGNATINGDLNLQGGETLGGSLQTPSNISSGGLTVGTVIAAEGVNQPVITPQGTTGSTFYEYRVIPFNASGSAGSNNLGAVGTGNATLSSTNKNHLSWTAITGAIGYNIYRVFSNGTPNTQGLIGTVYGSSANTFDDTGLAADGSTSPTTNTTGQFISNGSATFGDAVPSTSAFQILSAPTGYSLFGVDTTTGTVNIGGIGANSETVNIGTSTNSTQTVNITNANYPSRVNIGGRGTSTGQLYVSGSLGSLGNITGAGASTYGNAVAVQGHYSYEANYNGSTLQITDVSNPTSPLNKGSVSTGTGGLSLSVEGGYAYVVTSTKLVIIDISNPSSPVVVNGSGTALGGSGNWVSLLVQGRYAYVINQSGSLVTFDISTPSTPVVISTFATGGTLTYSNAQKAMYIQGKYLYIAEFGSYRMQILDISNPASPVSVGILNKTDAYGPSSIVVQGRYAYASSIQPGGDGDSSALDVYDVSNPASPSFVGQSGGGADMYSLAVQGRYAYLVGDTSIFAFDISSPASPTYITGMLIGGGGYNPYDIVVQGRYAYIAAGYGNLLQIMDLGGTYTQQLQAGGIETGGLTTNGNSSFNGDINLQGALTVGASVQVNGSIAVSGGINLGNGSWLTAGNSTGTGTDNILKVNGNDQVQFGSAINVDGGIVFPWDAGQVTAADLPISASTTAGTQEAYTFRVGSDNVLTIYGEADGSGNSQNRRIGVGTNTPAYSADVVGDINTSTQYRIGGNVICTSSGCTPAAGSNNYVQLQSTTPGTAQTGNLNISGTAIAGTLSSGTVTSSSTLSVDSNGTSNLNVGTGANAKTIQIGNLTGGTVLNLFGGSGGVTVKAGTNSTTAFQVQTQGGSNVLNVDSTTSRVNVGVIGTPTGQLYVGGLVPTAETGHVSFAGSSSGYQVLYIQGRRAYVLTTISNLTVYDISNPASPVSIGTFTISGSAYAIYVQGRYAYITIASGSLQVIDISNPASLSLVGSVNIAANANNLYVQGRYAYVSGAANSPAFQVIDISNPASPTLVASTSSFDTYGMSVQGRYAYVAVAYGTSANTLQVMDLANPLSPTDIGSVATGTNPIGVYVQGRYAYVALSGGTALQIFDVSNPTTPVSVGSVTTTTNAVSVYVQGRYAYVANSNSSSNFQVIDVSNPASPTAIGSVSTNAYAGAIYIQGRYAYVWDSLGLQTFDVGGTYDQQLQAGGIETGTLQVQANSNINGDESIQGGLTVGQSLTVSGNAGISGSLSVNGITSLQGSLYLLGGIGGGVTISGLSAPATPVITQTGSTGATSYSYEVTATTSFGESLPSVAGTITTGFATLGGTRRNVITWNLVNGATGYKVYRTASGGTPSSTGLIGSTTALTFTDNGIAATTAPPTTDSSAGLSVNGVGLFKTATNSTTAFQIQNSSGVSQLTLDTTTGNLTVVGAVKALHFVGTSSTPTFAAGAGAGTSPTSSVTGNDAAGQVSVTTGTGPTGSNSTIITITFNTAYGTAPTVILTPGNNNAAALTGATQVYVSSATTANFVITSGASALGASTQYIWYYHVIN